jgi:transposase, IS30 family
MENTTNQEEDRSVVGTGRTYRHLDQFERDRIQSLLDQDVCEAEIARILRRDKSTIGREIKRNQRKRGEVKVANQKAYESSSANHKAYVKRHNAKYQGMKIERNKELQEYIISGLKKHWGPDEISGSMKENKLTFYASKSAIYRWLYSAYGQPYARYLCTKRFKPKPQKPEARRAMIPDRIGIEARPEGISSRIEYGHHEADTIVSSKRTGGKAALAVNQERKSRLISARKMDNLKPKTFATAMNKMNSQFVSVQTITYDNGIENRDYQKLGVTSYFCDPYSSWQKGGVENANRMIRRFFPKGTNFDNVSPQKLAYAIRVINNKPRKILGYKSALQIAKEEGLLRDKKLTKNAARG